MCQNRLTKKVFNWNLDAARINKNNWCFRVRSKFTALGSQHSNDVSGAHCADEVLEYMDTCVFEDIEQKWQTLASLRCGVAPLHIETWRYSQLSVDESGSVET